MKALRLNHYLIYVTIAALSPVVIGCGDSFEPPPDLVGTWNATSLVVDGFDVMTEGMTLSFTFSADGAYSYTATNDQLGFCDPGPNCTDGGDFTAESNQLTIDPDTVDEETYSYSISGSTLIFTANFGGASYTLTFVKQ